MEVIIHCPLKEDMLLLRTFAPWLLLVFLGQQVSLSSGARNKNRGADKTVTPAPGRAQRRGNKPAESGKFSIKDKMQCTWRATNFDDTVTLSVKCENREARSTDLECQYKAKPQSCPGYQSQPKAFWKQVARAFKRLQGKVCTDDRALVRAGVCKRAPREAHFKLDKSSSSGDPQTPQPLPPRAAPTAAAPAGPTACTGRADHRKKAEEHCNSSWVSVCSFFFSMLQSDDC
ncbi:fibroblast growth factor-binding protein 1-like isoform X1 [Siniperca chuatsi]|uniref:fibroblast growth factor-binding protein 1-like isoform X1 n=1 Tax=Siniperca chuatsi TaxID=119488 RepID=UPI001CE02E60|nr:fibroblast growth factor-binding protein 1-like isoform X1 [Siniperca chuatsi]